MIEYLFLAFSTCSQLLGQGDVIRDEIDNYKEDVTVRSYSKIPRKHALEKFYVCEDSMLNGYPGMVHLHCE